MRRSRSRTARSGSPTPEPSVRVVRAGSPHAFASARRLIEEYVAGLGIDLEFQGIGRELSELPHAYAPPGGCVLLAQVRRSIAGCVAVRPLAGRTCEMKRLYVRPGFRGRGVGRALAAASLEVARAAGYRRMRLDTLATMKPALALYRSLGFRPIRAYRYNPVSDARYFELDLGRPALGRGSPPPCDGARAAPEGRKRRGERIL